MKVAKAALGVVMALTGVALPAQATVAQPPSPFSVAPDPYALARDERLALTPLYQAVQLRDPAGAAAALPIARSGARSPAARYLLGRLQYDVGVGTRNADLQRQALDLMLQSDLAPAADVPALLRQLAVFAYDANQLARAQELLNRAVQLQPTDTETIALLAQVYRQRGNVAQALPLLQRSLQLNEAAGRSSPESRYKVALALAQQGRDRAVVGDVGRRLVTAYPGTVNWRDTLFAYRDVAGADPVIALDILRLMRAAGALHGERDYLVFVRALAGVETTATNAQLVAALNSRRLAGEARAVLEEGVSSRMLAANDPVIRALLTGLTSVRARERTGVAARVTAARAAETGAEARAAADTLQGLGRHSDAAELYGLALTKTGEDPNLVNLRLGAALAQAGRVAEAESALRLVTGERADLAGLWLAWLARRPQA